MFPLLWQHLNISPFALFLPARRGSADFLKNSTTMSLIQDIREKYARWAVVAIAVSLLGFILMDAFAGRTGLFSGSGSNTVGKINGKKIDAGEFGIKVQDYEKRMGDHAGENRTEQAIAAVWDQEVGTTLLNDQYEKLGITVSDKELRDMLYGANPPQDLKQGFTDPATGVYNAVQAQQQINQINKSGTAEQKQQLREYLNALENQRVYEKYTALLGNTFYVPKWFIEKRNADNSLLAKISYVGVPYISIPETSVKVTDQEIENYVEEHKKQFELKEELRSINYLSFNAAANASDSAAARTALLELKPELDSTKDYASLVQRTGSALPYYDSYISKKSLQNPNKDSILAAPVGAVAGPFVDNGVYEISKIIDAKTLPDTVNVRHILIATHQPNQQTGEMMQVRDDATAKHLIDSIQGLLNAGQNFDSLVVKFSDDPGSKTKGGVYENVSTGQMVAPFNDFIFTNPVGSRGVVKTDFGYHLIEVLSQKGSSPAYKIVYLTKPIVASQETDDQASNDANMFAGNSKDFKTFNETWEKNWRSKGVNKLTATDIKPLDFSLNVVSGNARPFIKKVFEAEKGEIVGPERVGESYLVAVVTEVDKPGLPSANKVRNIVQPVLVNKKRAAQIKNKIGATKDLNQVAAKTGQQVQTMDSLSFQGPNQALAFESKVIGAAFNPDLKGKVSEPIEGQNGVYVIRVDNVSTVPVPAADIQQQRQMMEQQSRQMFRSPLETLKKAADIKDYRAKFY